MPLPLTGTATFEDLTPGQLVRQTGATFVTASDVDGWSFTLTSSIAQTETISIASAGPQNGSKAVEFLATTNPGISRIDVSPSSGRFTLLNIDIGLGTGGIVASTIPSITGYLNGQPVAGAVVSGTVDAFNGLVTFNVASNAGFQNITSFRINPGNRVTDFLIDNINAAIIPSLVITTTTGSVSFVSGNNTASTPITIDSGLTVADQTGITLSQAAVTISGGFQSTEDVLAFAGSAATGNIAATYNSTTGVLGLSSAGNTATLAQWQAAFEAVTYTDTAISPNAAARTITFSATDTNSIASTATRTVSVTPTAQTPIVTNPQAGSTTYPTVVRLGAPIVINRNLTITDRDSTYLTSGAVSITNASAGDVLAFTNTNSQLFGSIYQLSYTNGVLTLAASIPSTVAQWQAAFDAVTFATTSATIGSRSITFSVADSSTQSAPATQTIVIQQGPRATAELGSASFVSGDNVTSIPIAVSPGLVLTDDASSTLASATVAVTGNYQSGEDVLAFTNTSAATYGTITGTYANGVLTLSGHGEPLAQWQAALEAVTFTDTAITPATLTRTVSFTINDGANTSPAATRSVSLTATPQTPIVTNPSAGSTTYPIYLRSAAPVVVNPYLTVSDRDSSTLLSGTVAVTNYAAGDILSFVNNAAQSYGSIVQVSYNSAGVLQLSSTLPTTLARWQAALDTVTFSTTSTVGGSRTISFSVSDGSNQSALVTQTVSVRQGPVVTPGAGSASFVSGNNTASIPVAVSPGLTLTDDTSTTLASATVTITGNYQPGQDVLALTRAVAYGGISGTYANGALTLTGTGTETLSQWQAALEAVTYTDTAITPSTATRTVSFRINDGAITSAIATRTIGVTATNQTPIVTTTQPATVITPGTPVTIDPQLTVSDLDNVTLASATVAVSSGFQSGDIISLLANPQLYGAINAVYDPTAGILTLTAPVGSTSVAQFQAALDAVIFGTTSTVGGTRTISYIVNDGGTNSATATDDITVVAGPILSPSAATATFTAGDNTASTPVAVDPGLIVTDPSGGTLTTATMQISGNYLFREDMLTFSPTTTTGNITAIFTPGSGTLSLISAGNQATLAQWQAALNSVTYTNTAIAPNTAPRTISISATDASGTSNVARSTVTVVATDQTPVVTSSGVLFAYLSNAAPAPIDPALTVRDRDNATLAAGSVAITTGYQSGDTLAFTNTNATRFGDIAATYDPTVGILSLTSATAGSTTAQWQAALGAVTFSSTSAVTVPRAVSFLVGDGTKISVAATDTVNVLGSVTTGTTTSVSQPNFTVPNALTLPNGPLIVSAPTATPAALTLNGGTLTSGAGIGNGVSGVTIGAINGATGIVFVTGSNSNLNSNGSRVTLGESGAGSLTVSAGGTVLASAAGYSDAEAALSIAAGIGSLGTLTLTGAGSQVVVTGTTVIGGTNTGAGVVAGGKGSVTVGAGSTFTSGPLFIGQGSSFTAAPGATLSLPSITLAGGTADLGTLSSSTPVTLTTPFPNPSIKAAGTATHNNSLVVRSVSGAASINNFTFGDTIDLAGIVLPTGVGSQFTVGTESLTLNATNGVSAYARSDGNGGTLITANSVSTSVYRFYNGTDGSFIYTSSASEAQSIQQTRSDLVLQSTSSLAAITPQNGDPNAVAVYRFFNTTDGSHFLTADTSERDTLIATRSDLVYEASATFYGHQTQQAGDVPVYRFFNVGNGSHFFTDSAAESAAVLSSRPDLRAEGIAFYEAPH